MSTTALDDPTRLRANDPCFCGSGRKFKRCHRPSFDPIRPQLQSPRRAVPESIERPPYADTGERSVRGETDVKSADVIERMRRTGEAAAEILRTVGDAVAPGVTTDELDEICHDASIAAGGYPSPLNYGGFPKSVCTSVNEVICHGIPDGRALIDGDIVNLDVTLYREGVHGDTNATWCVGTVDDLSRQLVRVTRECLERAIEQVAPGRPFNGIGRVIQDHAEAHGFGVVRAFIGHGVGETFHSDLAIMHYFDPRDTRIIEEGMTFTIEPMIALGDWHHRMWDDDWTAVTRDGRRTAQFEHSLVVTADGVDVLTLAADGQWAGEQGPSAEIA
ncbi:MAG TPA: type I methionyl aminopeptidase [Acidimicrobiales bacterium]|nr:type I methionyl aminopeptidase [Acidimicrobiales bacterium]